MKINFSREKINGIFTSETCSIFLSILSLENNVVMLSVIVLEGAHD